MNIIVYFFVALIAAGSVLFGLDVVSAPMSPMPVSKYEVRAAVPPRAPVTIAETRTEPKAEAAASVVTATPPVAIPAPAVASAPAPQPAAIVAAEPAPVASAPAPRCDVDACTSAYRSFTAEDCTYQPSDGPRRLCTKGTPPAAATAASAAPPEARAQACNIAACSQSYPRSFSAADCTFLPAEGPRRMCTK
jgi:BA14K-like protein